MATQKIKSGFKLAIKMALSALAFYLVFSKIELEEVWNVIQRSNLWWLLAAIVAFNISQLFTSFRLLSLFRVIQLHLDSAYNVRLYYVGMFYNLFLPGGIGGDGYKVYHLKNHFSVRTRDLITAVFLDRLSGAATLAFLSLALSLFAPELFDRLPRYSLGLCMFLTVIALPVFFGIIAIFFKRFKSSSIGLVAWSLLVQILQMLCAVCILLAFGVSDNVLMYLVLFLLSSIAATLPISFGGIGLRELVFLYASKLLPIDGTSAVALALVFFIITAVSSFIGVFLKLPKNH